MTASERARAQPRISVREACPSKIKAPSVNRGLKLPHEASHPIMEAAGRSKQEGRQEGPLEHFQALDIPGKFYDLGGCQADRPSGRAVNALRGGLGPSHGVHRGLAFAEMT